MLSLSLPGRVFLCTLPTDMRKSFDSLAGLVEQELGQDPLAGDLFVFRSRRGDRLKLLYWDNDGAGSTMLHNRVARYLLYLLGVPGIL